MAAQVKVRERWLALLRLRLGDCPVCDDSAAEGGVYANSTLHK